MSRFRHLYVQRFTIFFDDFLLIFHVTIAGNLHFNLAQLCFDRLLRIAIAVIFQQPPDLQVLLFRWKQQAAVRKPIKYKINYSNLRKRLGKTTCPR